MLFKLISRAARGVYSGVDTPPVLDAEQLFPNHGELLKAFEALRAEAAAIGSAITDVPRFHELMAAQAPFSANDGKDWRIFIVKSYGYLIPANAEQAPVLAAILADQPEILSAAYSYLEPGKHIPPHRGPFRGIARYHLCLICDSEGEKPFLRLEGKEYPYHEGSWLLWDDTFMHEVENRSEGWRVALLLDIKRKDMPFPLRLFGNGMIGLGNLYSRLTARAQNRQ